MNMFDTPTNEIGDLNQDLVLKTSGTVRVQRGSTFIDLLKKIEDLEQRIERIEQLSSQS